MPKDDGHWLKAYRKMQDSVAMSDPMACWLWLKILFAANWKDGWLKGERIRRGEFVFSYRTLAENWGKSHNTIRHWFEVFEQSGMIEIRQSGVRQYSILKVVNYRKYQEGTSLNGVSNADTPKSEGVSFSDAPSDTPNIPSVSNADTPLDTPSDTDRRREEGKKKTKKASAGAEAGVEPEKSGSRPTAGKPPDDSPVVLLFERAGGLSPWPLQQSQIDRWEPLFPGIDVLAECRKAFAWNDANVAKRKLDVKRFLVNWLKTAQDRIGSKNCGVDRGGSRFTRNQQALEEFLKDADERAG
jgi:hypothetical protein